MKLQSALLCLAYFVQFGLSFSQTSIDTSHHCIYNQPHFQEEPYIFSSGDENLEKMVVEICQAAGVVQDFEVVSASVQGIAAVVDHSGKYLLYSRRYVRNLMSSNQSLLYAMLAHEIGHLVRGHELDGNFRLREESAADEFMGRVLYELKQTGSLAETLNAVRKERFAYAHLLNYGMRSKMIANGWNAADGLLRSKSNLGYLDNEINQNNLPLPLFNLRGCPQFYDMPSSFLSNCMKLEDVDHLLKSSLNQLGYSQLSYYYAPNGFALLTPVEQINKDGLALPGAERWKDYPAGSRFDGVLDYLSSLILPKPGHFRLFIFLVTDQNVRHSGQKIKADEVQAWLQNGGYWLPEVIGSQDFTPGHHLTVLVFEFQAPESTKKLSQQCSNQLFTPVEHLSRAGLLQTFRR